VATFYPVAQKAGQP